MMILILRKYLSAETDTLVLKLNRNADESNTVLILILMSRLARSPFPGPSQELIEQNSKRINDENDIRQKYIDSWMKPEEAKESGSET